MDIKKYQNSTTHDIRFEYNTEIKTYANGEKIIKRTSYSNMVGVPPIKRNGLSRGDEEELERQKLKNLYKTKQNIIDLAYHNGMIERWEYFLTLTFDDNRVNALDYNEVVEYLSKWLNNMKHQNPNMRYLIAPELHKSGRVHFHGIFANVPKWVLKEARNPYTNRLIKKKGLQIYNLTNYKLGFTTVSKVQDLEAVSVYISKYITKDFIDIRYKKKYWCSKNLERPRVEYAHFNEEELIFYISKEEIRKEIEIPKLNSSVNIIYIILSSNYY